MSLSAKINTVEDLFSLPNVTAGVLIHLIGSSIYDVLKRFVLRKKTQVKKDWSWSRNRVLFDSTGRFAVHGYEDFFIFLRPGSTPFLESDLTIEKMLADGKTHEEAHQACLERYDQLIKAAREKGDVGASTYLIADRENKFFKILETLE